MGTSGPLRDLLLWVLKLPSLSVQNCPKPRQLWTLAKKKKKNGCGVEEGVPWIIDRLNPRPTLLWGSPLQYPTKNQCLALELTYTPFCLTH